MLSCRSYIVALALASIATVGCSKAGPKNEFVTGHVTCKGKPVAGAGVRFYESRIGYSIVANIDAEGNFRSPSALPVGCYQVSITGGQPGGPEIPGAPLPSPRAPEYVDEAYQTGETSGLEARVSAEHTNFDYDLSNPPKKSGIPQGKVLARMSKEKPKQMLKMN